MKFSIILPCYNATLYLSACMDCLFANDLSDSEIILVNDGSKDDFAAWCRSYFACDVVSAPESKINWRGCAVKIITQPNMGVSAARNKGISHATGEYVLFVDPDDIVTPDYISTITGELAGNDWDFLLFGFQLIFEHEEGCDQTVDVLPMREYCISSQEEAVSQLLPNYIGRSIDSIDHWLNSGVFNHYEEHGSVCRCAYRREILEQYHLRFRQNIVVTEDGIFNCEFISHIRTAKTCMKPLYVYTLRNSGAVRRIWGNKILGNVREILHVKEQICADLRARGYNQVSYLWYAGSNVFSVFGIMRSVDFSMWKEVKRYIKHPTVQASIKAAPISLRKPAYFVMIMLLKLKLYWVLFVCYKICRKLKISFNLCK